MIIETVKIIDDSGTVLINEKIRYSRQKNHIGRAYTKWLSGGNKPDPYVYIEPVKSIQQQIIELESQITPRRAREALLSGDYSFIQHIEDQIQVLRLLNNSHNNKEGNKMKNVNKVVQEDPKDNEEDAVTQRGGVIVDPDKPK